MSVFTFLLAVKVQADTEAEARELQEAATARVASEPTGSVLRVDAYPPREKGALVA